MENAQLYEYLRKKREKQQADAYEQERSSDLGNLSVALSESANAFGTVDGKTASSDSLADFSKGMQRSSADRSQRAARDIDQEYKISNMGESSNLRGLQVQKLRQELERKKNDKNIVKGFGGEDGSVLIKNSDGTFEKGQLPTGIKPSASAGKSVAGKTLTPAQIEVDKKFGKDYAEYVAGGGYADVRKSLGQLKDVSKRLNKTDSASGPIIGSIPKFIRDRTNPESSDIQESIEEVVQRNLRLVLGAQFTEKEGQRLIERAYNPALDEKINAKRLDRLMKQIQTAAEAKQRAIDYYEENGTLQGFKGQVYTGADQFLSEHEDENEDAPPPKKTVTKKMVSSSGRTKFIYSDGSEEVVDGK